MNKYTETQKKLVKSPKVWLVTGVAGFIGSNLLEALLKLDQTVVGLDNFSTGHQKNLDQVFAEVTEAQWKRFSFIKGNICDYALCKKVTSGVDYVLHQAALGSVPRSILDPLTTNLSNITGFLNILHASKEEGVDSFTYAASSSTYGDHPALPKVEEHIGDPLSPYAVTKLVNEIYATVYARNYGFNSIGLRYFNVFGKRQDPNGAYAAVIPKWASSLLNHEPVFINGDGETSRDFCFISNVVQANILAATAGPGDAKNQIYNVAYGGRTTLTNLFSAIRDQLSTKIESLEGVAPVYREFRQGDVRHSQADISKARALLGYEPTHSLEEGLVESMDWYAANAR